MKSAIVITKKEVKTALKGPGFYIILFLFTALISYVSSQTLLRLIKMAEVANIMPDRGGGINMHTGFVAQLVYLMHFMLLLFIPALTSFSFAEERKARTMDLLLTSPITSTDIVLGKFFANGALVLILLFVSLLYPLSMTIAVQLDWPLLASSYLGIFLVSIIYVAIGIFSSSLSSSVIVSYVVAVVLSLFCLFISWGAQSTESSLVRDIINHISISKHLSDFIQGTLQVSSLVFTISAIGFFVFLTQRVIESARWR